VSAILWEATVWPLNASCDPAEITHLEQELLLNPNNIGVGVIDKGDGRIRLVTYDETDSYCGANPSLQVMAGHDAAAAMAGIPSEHARGFVLGKQGNQWIVVNSSHLNKADAQTNSMQMEIGIFNAIVVALENAGIQKPLLY
jgi:hypothetical protein